MRRERGFTLIELLIVMSILGLLMSFMMPALLTSYENARATTCLAYRQNIQVAADVYIRMNNYEFGQHMPTIADLVSEGLLLNEDKCPSGGIYVWNHTDYQGVNIPFFLYCSVHFAQP